MRTPLRFFIAKHPCDDLPYVHGPDPDPRAGDDRFTFDGPDYSGWYVLGKADISDVAFTIGRAVTLDEGAIEADPMMLHKAARAVMEFLGIKTVGG